MGCWACGSLGWGPGRRTRTREWEWGPGRGRACWPRRGLLVGINSAARRWIGERGMPATTQPARPTPDALQSRLCGLFAAGGRGSAVDKLMQCAACLRGALGAITSPQPASCNELSGQGPSLPRPSHPRPSHQHPSHPRPSLLHPSHQRPSLPQPSLPRPSPRAPPHALPRGGRRRRAGTRRCTPPAPRRTRPAWSRTSGACATLPASARPSAARPPTSTARSRADLESGRLLRHAVERPGRPYAKGCAHGRAGRCRRQLLVRGTPPHAPPISSGVTYGARKTTYRLQRADGARRCAEAGKDRRGTLCLRQPLEPRLRVRRLCLHSPQRTSNASPRVSTSPSEGLVTAPRAWVGATGTARLKTVRLSASRTMAAWRATDAAVSAGTPGPRWSMARSGRAALSLSWRTDESVAAGMPRAQNASCGHANADPFTAVPVTTTSSTLTPASLAASARA